MFGYVTANSKILSAEDKNTYRAFYCGLCHALKENSGQISRFTLNYDLTFLALFLNSVYDCEPQKKTSGCIAHPFKKHDFFENDIFSYCADMNILLMYYKMKDDWNDDKNIMSLFFLDIFKKKIIKIKEKYPFQHDSVSECLSRLLEAEKQNILIPDIPASIFGELMSALFMYKEDEKTNLLKKFGFHLGKFIYIADACCDIKKDLKKQSYNPLITTDRKNFKDILTLLLSDCTEIYNKLAIKRNKSILDNILYSGIWTKYELNNKKERKK